MTPSRRLSVSLIVYVLWIAITVGGAKLQIGGGDMALGDMIESEIAWQIVAASAMLVVAIRVFGWTDLRFTRPHSLVRILWFPVLYLLLFAVTLVFLGLLPLGVLLLVLLNTLFVGFSEETMFRGVLFRAFDERIPIWPAIIATSVLFGLVHLFNVFVTGQLLDAIFQSIAAGLTGLVFMAILIRTGSIWPAIIYHALWDWLIFSVGHATQLANGPATNTGEVTPLMQMAIPVLFNIPNVVCALILLRNVTSQRGDLPPTAHA